MPRRRADKPLSAASARARAAATAAESSQDGRVIRPEALARLRRTIVEHFSRAQYHEVGIRDICRQGGVSPQTVYKYFGSKEELLLACVEEDLARVGEEAVAAAAARAGDLRAMLEAAFETVFAFYGENAAIARIVFLNLPTLYWVRGRSAGHARFYEGVEALIREGRRSGEVRADAPVEVLRDWVAGGANRLLVRWLTEGGDVRAYGRLAARLAWDALRARA